LINSFCALYLPVALFAGGGIKLLVHMLLIGFSVHTTMMLWDIRLARIIEIRQRQCCMVLVVRVFALSAYGGIIFFSLEGIMIQIATFIQMLTTHAICPIH
jgi:hypothetical protein